MKYKVRIKKSPQTMAYGGQAGYGLDLGARSVYGDIADNPYDSVSDTLQPVDRSAANIEAELGETIVGDFDQDGRNEHMKVGGKPHSQGGTPLAVPEGSFVYSQTRKMAIGGPILAMFGKSMNSKKKYTPAQLAKQYDINTYKAMLDDPHTDALTKSTAARMIANYEKKLGGLALVQEAVKGFPQGIPQIAMPYLQTMMPAEQTPMAEYGGYIYETGGEKGPGPKKVKKEEIAGYEKQGYTRVPGTNVWRKTEKGKDVKDVIIVPGKPGSNTGGTEGKIIPGQTIRGGSSYRVPAGCENLLYTPEDVKARPGCYNTFLNKNGFKDASEEEMKEGLRLWKQGQRPTYQPGTPGTKTDPTPETKTCPDGYTPDPNDPTKCIKSWEKMDEITYDEPPPGEIPPGEIPPGNRLPFFGRRFMARPKRYTPYVAPLNAMIPNPTFYDPNRELAEGASQRNMTMEYMAGMDPQAFGARASAVNAQGAEQAANTIGRYQNMNVGVANQFSPLQTDIMNRVMAYRADGADKLVWNAQQLDKEYRNAVAKDLRDQDMYNMGMYNYNTKKNMLNAVNPWFEMVDQPGGGNIRWRPGASWESYVTGRMPGASAQPTDKEFESAQNYARQLQTEGFNAGTINFLMQARYPNVFRNRSSSSSRGQSMMRNYMGLNMPGAMNSYSAFPFDMSGFDIEGE